MTGPFRHPVDVVRRDLADASWLDRLALVVIVPLAGLLGLILGITVCVLALAYLPH